MTEGFIWDYESENARQANDMEAYHILRDIHHEITKDGGKLQYSHKVSGAEAIS